MSVQLRKKTAPRVHAVLLQAGESRTLSRRASTPPPGVREPLGSVLDN